ncbi:ATP-dependent RNA helicase RhlB [Gammaproteobacteria bacterium]|nr:ATP-dependent RNA helicase RhlB [Gammaproteobacteria bacterium]
MTNDATTDVRFDSLGLNPQLIDNLKKIKFETCTPIQALSLPQLINGRDVAGKAQTGTGKTIAFLLGTLHHLLGRDRPSEVVSDIRCLILAPTRELAIQIHADAIPLVENTGIRLGLAYGGIDYEKQRQSLEDGVDILIGTPGRIIDYYKQKVFSMKHVEVAVLDEADRMFDLGFIKDIRYLFRQMPEAEQRLNQVFSATLSQRVKELAYEYMNDPETVEIESDTITADRVEQRLYYPATSEKIGLLIGLLRDLKPQRAMVFSNTRHGTEKISDWLLANGFKTGILSGDIPQNKRQRLLEEFKKGELDLLVATDVAARGLHIPDVSHVFNFDLPDNPEDYVHRIGRTARAGAEGIAISFACEQYAMALPDIEDFIEAKIPSATAQEGDMATDLKRPSARARRDSGPRKGAERSAGDRPDKRRSRAPAKADVKTKVDAKTSDQASPKVTVKEASVEPAPIDHVPVRSRPQKDEPMQVETPPAPSRARTEDEAEGVKDPSRIVQRGRWELYEVPAIG